MSENTMSSRITFAKKLFAKISKKITVRKLHEITGLTTGLVVFFVSMTGAVWAYKNEIENLLYSDYKVVAVQNKSLITASKAKLVAESIYADKAIHGVLYGRENEAIEVIFWEASPKFYRSVFIDPYDGNILHIENHLSGFFAFALDGHQYLWLPKNIGGPIVTWSIFAFFINLSFGLFLWWPKNQKAKKQRLKFDWKESTRWKRKNYDLHTVLGFYIYSFAIALAFTGSVMSFDWFYFIAYKAAGGDKTPAFYIPENLSSIDRQSDLEEIPMNQLIPKLKKENPEAIAFELHYPHDEKSSIYVEVSRDEGLYYSSDYRFFDQRTLEEIETTGIYGKYEDADFADNVIRMNYDIHLGAIGGLFGKTIAFFSCLLVMSLPITGFLMWYGRHFKKTKINAQAKSTAAA